MKVVRSTSVSPSPLIWITCVVATVGLISSPPPLNAAPGHELSSKGAKVVMEQWQELMEKADAELLQGEWRKAERRLQGLLDEMSARLIRGSQSASLLASAVALRAIARSGQDEQAEAEWDWAVALSLNPEIASVDRSRYGSAAVALRDPDSAGASEPMTFVLPGLAEPANEEESAAERECDRVTGPVKKRAPQPWYPRAKREACVEAPVLLALVITTEGRVKHPRFSTEVDPVLAYAALETIREWRFEPARACGKPISVFYNLTVNYKTTLCLEERD